MIDPMTTEDMGYLAALSERVIKVATKWPEVVPQAMSARDFTLRIIQTREENGYEAMMRREESKQ